MRLVLLTVIATFVLAPVASAATAEITLREIGVDPRSGPIRTPVLEYTADAGEGNRLTIAPEAPNGFRVRDDGAAVRPGSGCMRVTDSEVTCAGATSVSIVTGDGEDTVTLSALDAITSVAAGPGADTVNGGPGFDSINGGGGRDTLLGGAGGDALEDGDETGTADADTLDGGEGEDTLLYTARTSSVTVDLTEREPTGETGERDTVSGIENVEGGSAADTLRGDDGDNDFDGGRGHDRIEARGGDDRIDCGRGNDTCDGGDGDDEVIGTRGRDTLAGGAGNDDVASGGGRANDLLSGGAGRDRLYANFGRDVLKGGSGPDIIYARDRRRDRINGGSGDDRAKVDRKLDRVRSVETLR